ncbi:MAG: Calx-beta domain-containing protein [Panacagrimonas sp.]
MGTQPVGNEASQLFFNGFGDEIQAVNNVVYFNAFRQTDLGDINSVYRVSVDSFTPQIIGFDLVLGHPEAGGEALARQGRDAFAAVGSTVLFGGSFGFFNTPGNVGAELYGSVGGETAAVIADFLPGNGLAGSSSPNRPITVGGKVFFFVTGIDTYDTDGDGDTEAVGDFFLGVSDGTQGMSWDLQPGAENDTPFSEIAAAGNRAVFEFQTVPSGFPTSGANVWVSDGTQIGTQLLDNAPPGDNRLFATACPGKAVWVNNGSDLWVTDGTPEGTSLLRQFRGVEGRFNGPATFARVGSRIVFGATDVDGARGTELWVSDCTPAGTREIDVNPGNPDSNPSNFAVVGNRVFFLTDIGGVPNDIRYRLYVSDFTQDGTEELLRGLTSNVDDLVASSTHLFFIDNPSPSNYQLFSLPIPPPDTTPQAFNFTDVTRAALGSVQTSVAATILDINALAPVSVTNGTYSIGCNGPFVSTDGMIDLDQTVCVRHTASGNPATTVTTVLDVGGVMANFSSTTAAAPRTLSINDVASTEGNSGTKNFTFTISLSAAASGPVSVRYATANGTATVAGNDYTAKMGTVSFAVGQRTKTVNVVVRGDTTVEPNETFVVNLSNPVGATIADGSGTATITNDDVAPGLPSLRINDVSLTEGPRGRTKTATFTVTLSRASTQTVTVRYATANGTAVVPGDYTSKSGSLSFAPGATSRTVSVTVKGDSTREPNEVYGVNLSNATNATIGDGQGIGTVRNDD